MKQPTKVVFLHRGGLSGAGSKIMRCDQLSEICRKHIKERFEFHVMSQRPLRSPVALRRVCRSLEGCVVIMLKGTASVFGEEGLQLLRQRARAICIDYVDADVSDGFVRAAHVHIGASWAGCRLLQKTIGSLGADAGDGVVMHLAHHADPRLASIRPSNREMIRIAYLGDTANAYLPQMVRKRLDVLRYRNDSEIGTVFAALAEYAVHYGVRSVARRRPGAVLAKPFT